jgi:hypothetical protein
MVSHDDVRLHQRLKKIEEKLAEQQQQAQPQEEKPETAAQKIANMLRENAKAAELEKAFEDQDSENGAKRTAARIRLALNELEE